MAQPERAPGSSRPCKEGLTTGTNAREGSTGKEPEGPFLELPKNGGGLLPNTGRGWLFLSPIYRTRGAFPITWRSRISSKTSLDQRVSLTPWVSLVKKAHTRSSLSSCAA